MQLLVFYWGIIAFQCCASFCCTTTWISYMYTYICSLLNLPSTPSDSILPGHLLVIIILPADLPVLHSRFPPAVYFTQKLVCICQCHSPSSSSPPHPPSPMSTSVLYVCISIPALQIGISVLSHKMEWNWVVCTCNRPRVCYTEWSKSEMEKQILYVNSYIWIV